MSETMYPTLWDITGFYYMGFAWRFYNIRVNGAGDTSFKIFPPGAFGGQVGRKVVLAAGFDPRYMQEISAVLRYAAEVECEQRYGAEWVIRRRDSATARHFQLSTHRGLFTTTI